MSVSPPFTPASSATSFPSNVGIHAIDVYFPPHYVLQSDLEQHYGVSSGKYTIGLGQTALAFCTDREDIYSICLTAVSKFLKKFNINPNNIGRLECGTETILDHSKSIKSFLMQLFPDNTDIEGIDSMNACYAGTNALFNSIDWVESSSFDGRYAMVVAADIAEYAAGPARPTGGAGAIVMLIGPNAPLVLERRTRSSHMEHVWDFYKPNHSSPFPLVDGKYSNSCYLRALDKTFNRYIEKYNREHNVPKRQASNGVIDTSLPIITNGNTSTSSDSSSSSDTSSPPPPPPPVPSSLPVGRAWQMSDCDYVILHAPYNKLTQKGFARLYYNDYLLNTDNDEYEPLYPYASLSVEQSYTDLSLEKTLINLSKKNYLIKVNSSILLPTHLGNLYTASLYAGLLSLIYTQADKLVGKRITLFSYGSGACASMFTLYVPKTIHNTNNEQVETSLLLKHLSQTVNLTERLTNRIQCSPELFETCMNEREHLHLLTQFEPKFLLLENYEIGTYYLIKKNQLSQREYGIVGQDQPELSSSSSAAAVSSE